MVGCSLNELEGWPIGLIVESESVWKCKKCHHSPSRWGLFPGCRLYQGQLLDSWEAPWWWWSWWCEDGGDNDDCDVRMVVMILSWWYNSPPIQAWCHISLQGGPVCYPVLYYHDQLIILSLSSSLGCLDHWEKGEIQGREGEQLLLPECQRNDVDHHHPYHHRHLHHHHKKWFHSIKSCVSAFPLIVSLQVLIFLVTSNIPC